MSAVDSNCWLLATGYWLLTSILSRCDTGLLAEPNQLGDGYDAELLHDAAAVDLDRFFGNARLGATH